MAKNIGQVNSRSLKIALISIAAIGACIAAYLLVQRGQQPLLTVTAWDGKVAQFTFGNTSGSTATNGSVISGTWGVTNNGNALTIIKNGAIVKTVNVGAVGPVVY